MDKQQALFRARPYSRWLHRALAIRGIVRFSEADWLEWVLPRKEGDVTVFAPTRELAAKEIRRQGFQCDQTKLVQYDRRMTEVQHKKGIA